MKYLPNGHRNTNVKQLKKNHSKQLKVNNVLADYV